MNAFATISESLTKNDFVRKDASFDNDRLTPTALKELYNNLLNEEATRQRGTNGSIDGSENPRKRKLSSPPRLSPDEAAKDPKFWSSLIDRLYLEYRNHAVIAIKSDETRYDDLVLKLREADATTSNTIEQEKASLSNGKVVDSSCTENETIDVTKHPVSISEPQNGIDTESGKLAEKGVPTTAESVTSAPQTAVPTPEQTRSNDSTGKMDLSISTQTALASQHATTKAEAVPSKNGLKPVAPSPRGVVSPSPTMPPLQPGMIPPTASPMRPGVGTPGPPPGFMHPGMPYPPNAQLYPYPPNFSPHAWGQQPMQQQQQALRASPYAQQQPMQDFTGHTPIMARSPQQPPLQPQYQPYLYPPGQYMQMQPYMHSPGPMTPAGAYPYPLNAANTPIPARNSLTPRLRTSLGGRSPWKSTPSTTQSEIPRPPSREVSPIPERVAASIEATPTNVPPKSVKSSQNQRAAMRKPDRPARRGRAGSASPSLAADRSRSESILSQVSDARNEPRGRRTIKNETPSTPLPLIPSETSDNDQRRSTTRRVRGNTLQSESQPRHHLKRKRGDSIEAEDTPETPRPPASGQNRPVIEHDKVYATRNFARICGPIMNDVTAHKHAGIFAKPLTERDAPGYKSLIYRPSDLKSIKSMIHAGTKAVNAALEEAATVSTPIEGGMASPAVNTPTSNTAKNAAILLDKTSDLVPPKAIVNSAQLEKELLRMFANAVMFNPMPRSERAFGPDVHLTTGGLGHDEETEEGEGGAASVEFKGYSNEEDSGNIIRDTREMMEDVAEAVRIWRDAEQGSIAFGEEFGPAFARAGSTSNAPVGFASDNVTEDSALEQDDADGESTTSVLRKRRRVVEA